MPSKNHLLALVRQRLEEQRLIEASSLLKDYLREEPNNVEARFLMARIARLAGQPEMALKLLENLLILDRTTPEAILEKAFTLAELGRAAEADSCFEAVLEIDPQNYEAHSMLGRQHASALRLEDAVRHLRAATAIKPDLELLNLLGHLLVELGLRTDAEKTFRTCLQLDPNHTQALLWLGNLFRDQERFDEALVFYQRALASSPGHLEVLYNLACTCLTACAPISDTIDLASLGAEDLSRIVFALSYASELSREKIAEAHRVWAARETRHLAPRRQRACNSTPGRRLRIGFVSADFYQHPVGRYAVMLAGHLRPEEFTVFAYHNGERCDTLTKHLQSIIPNWRRIGQCDDEATSEIIQKDQIDVLVDLSGQTAKNRLLVFARRPAPLQITGFAYPNTTGLSAMDYRVTDVYADPPGFSEHLYAEKLIRLSKIAWPYLPLATAPDLRQPPYLNGQPFTFGCLNNPVKVSNATIQLWSAILKQARTARLLLLSQNDACATRLRKKFIQYGIQPDRLSFVPVGWLTAYSSITKGWT